MKYIGFFSTEDNKSENRIHHMSSHNKMLYIASVLVELGEKVEIVSPSWTKNNQYFKGKSIDIDKNISLILGPTIPNIKILTQLWSIIWLSIFLIKNTKKHETIVVYHSLTLMLPIKILRYLKNVKVLLEVEEIYSQVINDKRSLRKQEINYIKKMDARILVSDKLKTMVGVKQDIVLYGSYVDKRNQNIDKKEKSLVYAGTIDRLKGGAFIAIKLMEYIHNRDTILYILGSGESNTVREMNELIDKINKEKGYNAIVFLGEKRGEKFDKLMNTFSIGLNLQHTGKYMESAFPSKILTYFTYGQAVISTKVESIYQSPFAKYINFVENENFKEMAVFISKINNNRTDRLNTEKIILEFHEKFKREIKNKLYDFF